MTTPEPPVSAELRVHRELTSSYVVQASEDYAEQATVLQGPPGNAGILGCFLGHGNSEDRSTVMFQEAECVMCHSETWLLSVEHSAQSIPCGGI